MSNCCRRTWPNVAAVPPRVAGSGHEQPTALPTNERIQGLFDGRQRSGLGGPYFQFGRYLLISCSRPGGQPAKLQGLWNESTTPPWGSKYTININTEMNYWPAEPCNLAECVEPLVGMISDLSQTGARTARTQWGAGGWVAHHNTDLWRAAAPIDGPAWGFWPTGGAWLCRHLWDHYAYGGDREFLSKAYPIMKGSAQFFLDTLVEEPSHHWLVTCPSLSPENQHPHGAAICAGPAWTRRSSATFLTTRAARRGFWVSTRRSPGNWMRRAPGSRRCRLEKRASCRNGWKTGTWTLRNSSTAMFPIFTPCIRAIRSRRGRRRNLRRRRANPWTFAATSPRAGPRPGG